MDAWQTILLTLGGNAVAIAVLGFLAKSLLEKLIVRDTRAFETDLKTKSDSTIERLKTELQLTTIEHQVRFSKLHEKRAEVITELYGYLVEALWEAESFLSLIEWNGEPTKKEKHSEANKKLVELYRYFDKNRIYIPKEICSSLDSLVKNVRSQVIKFGVWVGYENNQLTDDSHKQKMQIGILDGMLLRMRYQLQENA